MTSLAEQHFMEELRDGTARLKAEINYNPRGFIGMVFEHGPVEASRRLIMDEVVSDGFTTLWEHHKLDMTVEALSLKPWYWSLFDEEVRAHARHKLMAYEFDVDGFVASATAAPPSWTQIPL